MDGTDRRAQMMADDALRPLWAEVERLNRAHLRLTDVVLLPASGFAIVIIAAMSALGTYAHHPWLVD